MTRRRTVRSGAVVLAVLSLLLVGSDTVRAHDVTGSRFDAPLPLSWLFVGAAGAVAVTALWLAVTGRTSTSTDSRAVATVDARTARRLRVGAGGVFFLGVVAALVVGVVGRQVAAENVATVFTWPVWFRGLGLLAILIGSPWPALSPWRNCYRGLCWLEGGQPAVLKRYPARLGSWPALAGFLLLVGIVENLTVIPRSPAATTVVIAVYALAMLAGGVLFGPKWFERADPLGVLYRLFGRVAGLDTDRTDDGAVELSVRPPWQGCTVPVSGLPIVAFIVAAVYTVSFDGFTNTRLYRTVLFTARGTLGTGPPTDILLYAVGLVAFLAAFVATIGAGNALPTGAVDRASGPEPRWSGWRDALGAFAPTVLPIAAAYDVAHNYPYVVRSSARLFELVVASVGVDTGPLAPLGWLSLPAFWGTQVVLIVVGHVIAVVAANQVAVERYASLSAARRAHLPLVVLMVCYTVLSLWIISQPVVA